MIGPVIVIGTIVFFLFTIFLESWMLLSSAHPALHMIIGILMRMVVLVCGILFGAYSAVKILARKD